MKTVSGTRFVPLLLAVALVLVVVAPAIVVALAQPTVPLGTTSSFAILSGQGITNTGTTWIGGDAGGDVGSHPNPAFTGQASVTLANGVTHLGDATALTAKNDLITAYDNAAARTPTIIGTELGGQTLLPGVYHSDSGTFEIAAGQTLTLDAQGDPDGVFVFQTDTTLVTFTGSVVHLANSARFCRVFWKVGSSATLGTSSTFVGHIFALTSIAAANSATVNGQLLARNGSVTLDTNTITNGICAVTPATATLHVIKLVINNDGRTSVAADFTVHVKASGIDVAGSPASGAGSPGTAYTLAAGSYVVSEDSNSGYTVSYSGGGVDPSGRITLAADADVTVTITNNDTRTTVPGVLPNTATPWYNLLLVGAILVLVGAVGYWSATRKTHA